MPRVTVDSEHSFIGTDTLSFVEHVIILLPRPIRLSYPVADWSPVQEQRSLVSLSADYLPTGLFAVGRPRLNRRA